MRKQRAVVGLAEWVLGVGVVECIQSLHSFRQRGEEVVLSIHTVSTV